LNSILQARLAQVSVDQNNDMRKIASETRFREIEHVGCTAVAGLAAKPVIDLMASADDPDGVDVHALDAMGFRRAARGLPSVPVREG
jgi:GrpB-like predicted nucleotidyltransferase (UPF0157 family)